MDSIFGPGDRPPQDLTARARIRDAALAQFAEHGTKGTTMRGVAGAAGVSIGLVQHHFGSKEALRRACDEAVVDLFRRRLTRRAAEDTLGEPGFMAELFETSGLPLRYLARAMVDGSDAAAYVFDQLTSGTEEFLTSQWPDRFPPGSARVRDAAAVMAAMHSGTVVLHHLLARRLGVDPLEREHVTRIGMAIFDVYRSMGEYIASPAGEGIRESTEKYRDNPGAPA
jgi:AcrR family transcriptional regulator